MSGVEVAGLVLGAFPIIVQLINGYKEGCQPLGAWLRFRKTFLHLIQGIRYQETRLYNNVKILLLPLVDDDEELQRLLAHPWGNAWKSSDLEEALQRRLNSTQNYHRYCEIIGLLKQKLDDFQQQLGIAPTVRDEILVRLEQQNTKALRNSTEIDWKFEWSRIKVSWARKDLLLLIEDIDSLNKKLAELLGDSEKLNVLEQKRSKKQTVCIQRLRSHATALYSFLARQWPCSCQASHSARTFLKHKAICQWSSQQNTCDGIRSTGSPFEISMAVEGPEGSIWLWQVPLACTLEEQCAVISKVSNLSRTQNVSAQQVTNTPTLRKRLWKKTVSFQDTTSSSVRQASPHYPVRADTSMHQALNTQKLCWCLTNFTSPIPNTLGPFIEGQCRLTMLAQQHALGHSNGSPTLIKLADVLTKTPQSVTSGYTALSMSDRVRLAFDLASSFFYIFNTPWYRQQWGKEDVQLTQENKHDAALLETRFPAKDKGSAFLQYDARSALICLGVCLEELCFGMPLESMNAYSRFCGPNGPGPRTSQHAAQEVLDEVEGVLGEQYHIAVKKCLGHALLADAHRNDEPEFWQKAYDDIVEPLRKVLSGWVSVDGG